MQLFSKQIEVISRFLDPTEMNRKPSRNQVKQHPRATNLKISILLGICVLIFVGGICNPDSFAEITQTTSTDGITLQFTLPELTISEEIRDNIRYQGVHYTDCHFTDEPGNPKVPVTRLMLGIPTAATIEAVDVSAVPAETRTGVRLVPVPFFDIHERNSQHSASQRIGRKVGARISQKETRLVCRKSFIPWTTPCPDRT